MFQDHHEDDSFDYELMFTCSLVIILIIIFMTSIILNVSILMVFARKQTLRTTSNRLEKILYLCCILTSNNILIPISGYNIFYLLRPLHCPHETKFKISNFSDELVLFFALLASYVGILETFYFLFPRFVVNMLVVNILSSSLYLPLVLLTLIINYNDTDQEVSDVNMVQSLLFQAVSHLVGALSVLSTLCTGKIYFTLQNIVCFTLML